MMSFGVVLQPGALGARVLGDRAAHHDAGADVDLAAAPRRGSRRRRCRSTRRSRRDRARASRAVDVLGLVVDARVEAEVLDDPAALLVGAGDADDASRILDPRDLARDRADATGRAGHDDGLARLRATDLEQPEVRGDAGRAVDAQHVLGRDPRRHDLARVLARERPVVLPARQAHHEVARVVPVAATLDDLAEPGRAHDVTDADRRQVRVLLAHPHPVRRVHRERRAPGRAPRRRRSRGPAPRPVPGSPR